MAQIAIAVNEVRDPALATRLENEVYEAAAPAMEPDEGVVGVSILDEGRHVDLELELLGWVERFAIPSTPQPGAVRAAVERFLCHVGLSTR